METTIAGPDGKPRCRWCGSTPEMMHYHDTEWGYPVSDDRRLFEKLCLEGFQTGLSWRTILDKREHLREAFHHFDFEKVASYTGQDIDRLLNNKGIIRHRGKIEAVINNAKRAQELVRREGSLAAFLWRYEPAAGLAKPQTVSVSEASTALSKDLKKLGWKFVGPTTMHAFMQSMGLINDHVEDCAVRPPVEAARATFIRPGISAGFIELKKGHP
ncbi:DNA-3-methyladenine glycosylase I [Cohnella panacarvi]|uniref:DNA-3-methyladenine glycosylase I n=1 Tax=Cohnella panacarvi TaxID=400776 RepID=UPI0004792DAD|nr:DNA-3-methyladenine glycosylase I [Cohnella panacarvi]